MVVVGSALSVKEKIVAIENKERSTAAAKAGPDVEPVPVLHPASPPLSVLLLAHRNPPRVHRSWMRCV